MRASTIHRFAPAAAILAVLAAAQDIPPATGLLSSRAVAFSPHTGKAYAVDSSSAEVIVYDTGNRSTRRIRVGPAPVALAVNEVTGRVYVANSGGDTISVLDGASSAVAGEIKVGPRPYAVAVNPQANRIYVSNTFSDVIRVIDGASNAIRDVKAGSADVIAVDAGLDKAYLLHYESDHLTVLDGSLGIPARPPAGMHLWGMAIDEPSHTVYATRSGNAELAILRNSGAIDRVPVGAIPCAVAFNSRTQRVYVSNHGDDTVTVIDAAAAAVLATVRVGHGPQAVAVDEQKDLLYVANTKSNSVTVLDGRENRVLETLKTGPHPYALAVYPGRQLFVALASSPALEVIDR